MFYISSNIKSFFVLEKYFLKYTHAYGRDQGWKIDSMNKTSL